MGVCAMPQPAMPVASRSVARITIANAFTIRRSPRPSARRGLPIVFREFTCDSARFVLAGPGGFADGEKAGRWVRGFVRSGGRIRMDAADDDVDAHDRRRAGADDVGTLRDEQT